VLVVAGAPVSMASSGWSLMSMRCGSFLSILAAGIIVAEKNQDYFLFSRACDNVIWFNMGNILY
jgi:hypothetical protein